MPHFHFDIEEDGRLIRDDHGLDFPDASVARREAVETGVAIAREAFVSGSAEQVVIDVREDNARLVKVSITMDVEDAADLQRQLLQDDGERCR